MPAGADDSAAFIAPRPESFDELVDRAEVVVVVEVGEVIESRLEGPVGTEVPDQGADAPPLGQFPATYFDADVERVVFGSDVQEGEQIVFSVSGSPEFDEAYGGVLRMPQPGERLLLLLTSHPEIRGYFPVRWGIFDVEDDMVTYANTERTPVSEFTDRTSPEAFMAALEAAMKARTATGAQ